MCWDSRRLYQMASQNMHYHRRSCSATFTSRNCRDDIVVVVIDVAKRQYVTCTVGTTRDRRLYAPVGIVDIVVVVDTARRGHVPSVVGNNRVRRIRRNGRQRSWRWILHLKDWLTMNNLAQVWPAKNKNTGRVFLFLYFISFMLSSRQECVHTEYSAISHR